MLVTVQRLIADVSKKLGIEEEAVEKLLQTDAEHVFDINLKSGKSYKAYRVQHSNKSGPYKGGIRFHENVSLDEVRALAILMSLKTAAVGLPLGGGKGGVAVNPRNLSKQELEELSRKYVQHLHPHIGPSKDVPAPDVNTNTTVIDWMVDEYEKLLAEESSGTQAGAEQGAGEQRKGDVHASTSTAQRSPQRSDVPVSGSGASGFAAGQADAVRVARASFTGKSVEKGGSLGRDAATGRGGVIAFAELLKHLDKSSEKLTYAIQGFGNVGMFFAATAKTEQPAWKLSAASDSGAVIYADNGLDVKELKDFKKEGGRFSDYKKTDVKILKPEQFVGLDVDVLVLAALEDAVNEDNAKDVKAKYIVEMANGPVNGSVYKYLTSQGIIVLPDIIANSGGVIVSYLEWLQNKKSENWPEEKVNKELEKYMSQAVDQMYKTSQEQQVPLKEAAFMVALKNLL